jgi:hypothetical protein
MEMPKAAIDPATSCTIGTALLSDDSHLNAILLTQSGEHSVMVSSASGLSRAILPKEVGTF